MPHEQGAWVLLFVSGGAVEGADGCKPTSRGLPPAVVWRRRGGGGWKRWSCACGGGGGRVTGRNCARGATLPCPAGQGALRGCGGDAVCPGGAKALLCGAPDFGGFTGKSTLRGGLPFRRGRQARWEGGESGVVVRLQGMERAFILVRRSASSIRGERGGPHLPRVAKTVRLPFPHLPRSRNHPAGRPAGSARTRPRDQLRLSF